MKRRQTALLLTVIIIASISGSWFMFSPSLAKQAALDEQNKLLASMETDNTEPETTEYYDNIEPDVFTPAASDVSIVYVPNETPKPADTPSVLENSGLVAIGVLEIEKISLKLPVVCGVTEEQLKIAVGLVPEIVSIGETGNAVIAGHRSYTYGKFFNRLGEIAIGDIITYTPKDGESMTFEVFEVTETEPGDQIAFVQPEDESIITLYTCTPIKKATHRLLVRAKKYEEVFFEERT